MGQKILEQVIDIPTEAVRCRFEHLDFLRAARVFSQYRFGLTGEDLNPKLYLTHGMRIKQNRFPFQSNSQPFAPIGKTLTQN